MAGELIMITISKLNLLMVAPEVWLWGQASQAIVKLKRASFCPRLTGMCMILASVISSKPVAPALP